VRTLRKIVLSDADSVRKLHRETPNPFDVDTLFQLIDSRVPGGDVAFGAFDANECLGIQLLYQYKLRFGGADFNALHSTCTLTKASERSQGLGIELIRESIKLCQLEKVDCFSFCIDSRLTGKWENECIESFTPYSKVHKFAAQFTPFFRPATPGNSGGISARPIDFEKGEYEQYLNHRAEFFFDNDVIDAPTERTKLLSSRFPSSHLILKLAKANHPVGFIKVLILRIARKTGIQAQAILTEICAARADWKEAIEAVDAALKGIGISAYLINNGLLFELDTLQTCGFFPSPTAINLHLFYRGHREDIVKAMGDWSGATRFFVPIK